MITLSPLGEHEESECRLYRFILEINPSLSVIFLTVMYSITFTLLDTSILNIMTGNNLVFKY